MYGIPVYDADRNAKKLMNKDRSLKNQIKSLLGKDSYHRNGIINRQLVASRIFNNKELLAQMNALVHPAVRNDFESWAKAQDAPYVLEESAIIYEAGLADFFDAIILVTADKETRIQRVMERDGISRIQVQERIKNQKPDKFKKDKADFIILNDNSTGLLKQVRDVHNSILKLSKTKKCQ